MGTAATVARAGFGGAPIGGLFTAVSDQDAVATLDAAWNASIRYFDTAPLYGYGLSERRLGEFLRGRPRSAYRLSTKVGRILVAQRGSRDESGSLAAFSGALPYEAVYDFSADGIRRSLESSLERLQVDYVDVAFIHDPDAHMDQAIREAFPALRRLQAEGLIREIGAGMNACEPLSRFVESCLPDAVMIAGRYTLLDQSAERALFPLCQRLGVRIVAAGVFNSGILACMEPAQDATFNYHRADAQILARARRIATLCRAYAVPLPAVAIGFVLRNPAVTSIVLGMRSPGEVRADIDYLHSTIPDALWNDLAAEGIAVR